jgi:methyl-accepting chemotaxis protein
MRWSVGRKIAGGYTLAVVALLVIGVTAFLSTLRLIDTSDKVARTHLVLEKLENVLSQLGEAESAERGYVITADRDKFLVPFGESKDTVYRGIEELQGSTAENPEQGRRLEDLKKLVDEKFDVLKEQVEARKDKTAESFTAAQEKVQEDKGRKAMLDIRKKVQAIEDDENARLHERTLAAEAGATGTKYVILIGIPLAMAIMIVAGYFITANISRPLQRISGAADRIASGDLSVKLDADHRGDEVGVLSRTFVRMSGALQSMATVAERIAAGDLKVEVSPQSPRDVLGKAFEQMVKSLQQMAGVAERIAAGDLKVAVTPQSERDVLGNAFEKMIGTLQSMATVAERIAAGDLKAQVAPQSDQDVLGSAFATMIANLRRIMADLGEGANVLGSASAQIVASTTELAAGSVQTASAVSETTATVEEVRQTSQTSSEKAKYVSESAQRAAAISESGKKTTDDAVEGMGRIRQQMSAIADSMVRLSEQTQAIGQIIATVDDLSQQSNLLAVNASIEAAKAGEQGKGFAVVAQEVRSLAAQSKGATTQVRTILSDIQKATAAAAMATEQGTKAVEAGVRQSGEAGNSILKLAGGVNEAAEAAGQIAASSEQQLAGMEQVATAMESIKQASNQNVDSARQLETAARNLERVGQRLTEMVGRYKV